MSETRSKATWVTGPGEVAAGGPRLGLALLVLATAQLMVVLDATIVNVALPHIQRALGFSGTGLEWVVNAYAITFAGFLMLGVRAADQFGQRRTFVAALLFFGWASLLGGLAPDEITLIVARAATALYFPRINIATASSQTFAPVSPATLVAATYAACFSGATHINANHIVLLPSCDQVAPPAQSRCETLHPIAYS